MRTYYHNFTISHSSTNKQPPTQQTTKMPFTFNPNDVDLVLGAIKQLADAKINARALAEYLYKKTPETVTKSNIDTARTRWNNFLARLEKAEKEGNGNGEEGEGENGGGKGKAKPNTPKKRKKGGEGEGDDLAGEDGGESKPTTPKRKRAQDGGEVTGSGKKVRKTGGKGRKAAVKEEVEDADVDMGDEADVEEVNEAWDA
jgi:hypothetical protein